MGIPFYLQWLEGCPRAVHGKSAHETPGNVELLKLISWEWRGGRAVLKKLKKILALRMPCPVSEEV